MTEILASLMPIAATNGLGIVLWIVAVIIGIWGLAMLFRGAVLYGILLIILAFAIGPGGWFILD
jgi:hypothetical protein